MRIAVDAMGGDFSPQSIVSGAVKAAEKCEDLRIVLVGREEAISTELKSNKFSGDNISIHHATEVISMGESPVDSIRRKKDSSIIVMAELASSGEVDAIFSAGNTGAMVAGSTLKLRYLKGIDRPGIATPMPTPYGTCVLIDAGATVDCRPINLLQFAVMGRAYAQYILKRDNPRVGLMNVGQEDYKGNSFIKDVFSLLDKHNINFIGNVEGGDLFSNRCDVIVCDGVIGNVVLKVAEGTAGVLGKFLKKELMANPIRKIGAILSKGAFADLKEITDHEEYGGAPLLGVNGISIIGHGSSSPRAIQNAIRVASEFIRLNVNAHIIESIENL